MLELSNAEQFNLWLAMEQSFKKYFAFFEMYDLEVFFIHESWILMLTPIK